MNSEQFNAKYNDYLEEGHYGQSIDDEHINEHMDKIFTDLIKIPGFKYSQVKLKFNSARVYTNIYLIAPSFNCVTSKLEDYITDYFQFYNIIHKKGE